MCPKTVLIPLATYGFDPTEVAIPWKILSNGGLKVVFITPDAKKATADRFMLTGEKLGIWKTVLRARQDAVDAYAEMVEDDAFCHPLKYNDVEEKDYNAILLPGGHDKDVKEYLESHFLQLLVTHFFNAQKPVGAICHGVVLAARSIDTTTGKSVIYDYKTTSLLQSQELLAYNLTRLWLYDYYLTYPGNTVEQEVKAVLSDVNNFQRGPSPVLRDSYEYLGRGFTVRDRNYLSARWPGDAYNFALDFVSMVQESN